MNKIISLKVGTIDYSMYPIITFTVKKVKGSLTKDDVDTYVNQMRNILSSTSGPFALITDTTEATWISGDARDYFGVAVQALDGEFLDRHKGHYIYIPGVQMYFLAKMIGGFIKTKMPIKFSFKLENSIALARKALEQ